MSRKMTKYTTEFKSVCKKQIDLCNLCKIKLMRKNDLKSILII